MSGSSNLKRQYVLAAISFFIGLQVRNLKDLFEPNFTNDDDVIDLPDSKSDYFAWAPGPVDPIDRGEPTGSTVPKRESLKEARARRNKEKNAQEGEEARKKKKKEKKPQRFNRGNYTNDFEPLPWSLPDPSPVRYQSSAEFMADYIAEKKRNNIPLPWEEESWENETVKLPLPITALNLPKSATLTMRQFFTCGGVRAIHTSTQQGRIGICMMENLLKGNPPYQDCDMHKKGGVVEKIAFYSDIGLQGPPCYYATTHDGGLEAIAEHYPESTILLVTRNATSWHRSISNWGQILKRWKTVCGFKGDSGDREFWVDFYQAHTQKIREFAMKHLSLTYVEVELEDKNMGQLLEYYTGVPSSCVMNCHPGPNWQKKNPNITAKCEPISQNNEEKPNPAPMETDGNTDDDSSGNNDDNNNDDEDDDDDEVNEQ